MKSLPKAYVQTEFRWKIKRLDKRVEPFSLSLWKKYKSCVFCIHPCLPLVPFLLFFNCPYSGALICTYGGVNYSHLPATWSYSVKLWDSVYRHYFTHGEFLLYTFCNSFLLSYTEICVKGFLQFHLHLPYLIRCVFTS